MGSVDLFLQHTVDSARSAVSLYFEPAVKLIRATLGRRANGGLGRTADPLFPGSENPGLRVFQEDSAQRAKSAQEEVVSGRFMKGAPEVPAAFAKLGATHSRFDAVSPTALAFWVTGSD